MALLKKQVAAACAWNIPAGEAGGARSCEEMKMKALMAEAKKTDAEASDLTSMSKDTITDLVVAAQKRYNATCAANAEAAGCAVLLLAVDRTTAAQLLVFANVSGLRQAAGGDLLKLSADNLRALRGASKQAYALVCKADKTTADCVKRSKDIAEYVVALLMKGQAATVPADGNHVAMTAASLAAFVTETQALYDVMCTGDDATKAPTDADCVELKTQLDAGKAAQLVQAEDPGENSPAAQLAAGASAMVAGAVALLF